ncbi:HNH endonuclease [Methylophilus sp.]|uniref:HNH endonuclease n=1 Tax=Methylophilus sp. TaxID=29541 RepID=UPI0025F17E55|nr:HNH endonuclease [Methylophilus sp.]
MTGKAGYEIQEQKGREIYHLMNKYPGQPFPSKSQTINELDSTNKNIAQQKNINPVPSHLEIHYESLQRVFENDITRLENEYQNKPGTDIDVIVKKRVGQSSFRNLLEKEHGLKCNLSGITHKSLLIASHITPWSKAEPFEKTDANNGLLLAINWDAVFDKGLMTFNENGEVLFSDSLDSETIKSLGLNKNYKLDQTTLNQKRLNYIRRHRMEIFNKNYHGSQRTDTISARPIAEYRLCHSKESHSVGT